MNKKKTPKSDSLNNQPSTCLSDFFLYADNPKVKEADIDDTKVGKWLLFENKERIDELWRIVSSETIKGQLGVSAKVSTFLNPNTTKSYMICVYTADYTNLDDVNQVRQQLRELGITQKIPYKTDSATIKGIYGKGSSLYYS